MRNNSGQALPFPVILNDGWVNPGITATPFTGYRKRAVSAPAPGAIQNLFPEAPLWSFFLLGDNA